MRRRAVHSRFGSLLVVLDEFALEFEVCGCRKRTWIHILRYFFLWVASAFNDISVHIYFPTSLEREDKTAQQ